MTADDRPSVTDNARAEAWDEGYQDGLRQGGEGEDGPRYVNPYRAAGRAETTTATDEDAPPVVVQAATVITANTDEPMWSAVVIAKEMASRGLLATARTRPTETEWGARHSTGEVCRHDTERDARGCVRDGGTGKRVVRREVTAWTEAE